MNMLSNRQDFTNECALVRAGFDVPIDDGVVTDTSRITAILPTILQIIQGGGSVIILAHQGRPKAKKDLEYTQRPVATALSSLLNTSVEFIEEYVEGEKIQLEPGQVALCENVRFYPGEKSKDANERLEFAKKIARHATLYVNDAFTNCHRAHASMVELPALLPAYVGLSLEQELNNLQSAFTEQSQPIAFIVAGAKIETKVPVIRQCLQKADYILTGGVIANTFLAAAGHDLGDSLIDADAMDVAKELLELSQTSKATILVPSDVMVADSFASNEGVNTSVPFSSGLALDIGTATQAAYASVLQSVSTIIWNGPVGIYERKAYAGGSKALASALLEATTNGAKSYIGGGDTIDFWNQYELPLHDCTFVSMGGGAMLTLLAGDPMPALDALSA